MLRGHRDLKVFQLAYSLAMDIFRLSIRSEPKALACGLLSAYCLLLTAFRLLLCSLDWKTLFLPRIESAE